MQNVRFPPKLNGYLFQHLRKTTNNQQHVEINNGPNKQSQSLRPNRCCYILSICFNQKSIVQCLTNDKQNKKVPKRQICMLYHPKNQLKLFKASILQILHLN